MKLVTELDTALEQVDHLLREDNERITVKQALAISFLIKRLAEFDIMTRVAVKDIRDRRFSEMSIDEAFAELDAAA